MATEPRFERVSAASAALLKKQNPPKKSVPAWCPGRPAERVDELHPGLDSGRSFERQSRGRHCRFRRAGRERRRKVKAIRLRVRVTGPVANHARQNGWIGCAAFDGRAKLVYVAQHGVRVEIDDGLPRLGMELLNLEAGSLQRSHYRIDSRGYFRIPVAKRAVMRLVRVIDEEATSRGQQPAYPRGDAGSMGYRASMLELMPSSLKVIARSRAWTATRCPRMRFSGDQALTRSSTPDSSLT